MKRKEKFAGGGFTMPSEKIDCEISVVRLHDEWHVNVKNSRGKGFVLGGVSIEQVEYFAKMVSEMMQHIHNRDYEPNIVRQKKSGKEVSE